MIDLGNRWSFFAIKKIKATQTSISLLVELEIQAVEKKRRSEAETKMKTGRI